MLFKEGYCTIEPNIDMPWRNRSNRYLLIASSLYKVKKMNQSLGNKKARVELIILLEQN